ncbi:hypothetical protein DdX_15989 [Ditylenchus destructor]|uniref:Uncharacterized protein n=1 Tax=Ditylenchus destructor TaxID=166010 RepID=A0AAD4MRU4_9BILA|nr:hypothetical protein DdX_15989 [Ditylenchus destructor]
MSQNAENGVFQGLKNRLFRRWNPLPSIYSEWDDIAHWSRKQPRGPASLRICKCRDHVKTEPETVSNRSESLPELDQDVTEDIDSKMVYVEDASNMDTMKARLSLWRIAVNGNVCKNR